MPRTNNTMIITFSFLIAGITCLKYGGQMYSNDRSMQYTTNVLTHNSIYSKVTVSTTCFNDPSYPYIVINSGQTTYSAIIVCNIHARELIATDICLRWLQELGQHTEITDKFKFTVFYRANNMRDQARTQAGQCIRKNKNGVDLNRNFPTEFNFYHAKPQEQIYPGTAPINQPFTICINETIQSHKPDFFLDIHSGEQALYYQQGINNDEEIEILKSLNKTIPRINVKKITTLKKDGESINGHIFADLKVRKSVPYSLLFETYDGQDDGDDDKCFEMFNPSTEKQRDEVIEAWSKAIMSTIQQVLANLQHHRAINPPSTPTTTTNATTTPTPTTTTDTNTTNSITPKQAPTVK